MATNAGKLNVKYFVTVGGKDYKVGIYDVEGKEYDTLAAAPYVEKVEEEVVAETKTTANTKTGNDNGNEGGNDDDVVTFTKEELEALSEEDLRALYAAEQEKVGKTAPANIKVETIIANLTK